MYINIIQNNIIVKKVVPSNQNTHKKRKNAREGGPEAPEMLPKIDFFEVFFGGRFSTLGSVLPSGKAGPP